jgi:hypothetical protein
MRHPFTAGQPLCPSAVLMRFIAALQRYPESIATKHTKLYLQEACTLVGVLCLLQNDFDDEVRKTRCSKNGCHCQGRASQQLSD